MIMLIVFHKSNAKLNNGIPLTTFIAMKLVQLEHLKKKIVV